MNKPILTPEIEKRIDKTLGFLKGVSPKAIKKARAKMLAKYKKPKMKTIKQLKKQIRMEKKKRDETEQKMKKIMKEYKRMMKPKRKPKKKPVKKVKEYGKFLKKYQLVGFIKEFKPETSYKILKKKKKDLVKWIRENFTKDELKSDDFFDKYVSPHKKMNLEKDYPLLKEEPEIRKISEKVKYYIGDKSLIEGEPNIKLQPHQKKFVEGFIFGNLRSAIIFHGTGTGKTLTAVASSRLYLQIYPKNKVIVITPSAVLYNFVESLLKFGVDPRDKRYSYWTYDKFYNKKKTDVSNALVIVDEAHNYRTALKVKVGYDMKGNEVVKFGDQNKRGQDLITRAEKLHKVILLTATPFINIPYDMENLLSIGDGRLPLSMSDFNDIIDDKERMSDYFKYRISKHEMKKGSKYFPKRIDNIQTFIVPKDYEKIKADVGMENKKGKKNAFYIHSRQTGLDYLNSKFKFIIKTMNTKKNKGKKFVIYTTFRKAGIDKIVPFLKKNNIIYGLLTGKESIKKKEKAKKDFNTDKIQCLIITMAGKEGVDLKGTRAIFLLDFLWNEAITEQIIARAIRYKSHWHLPKKDRYVEVYKLFVCYKPESIALINTKNKSLAEQLKVFDILLKKRRPSTDFYMYVLQKSKQASIIDMINKIEKVKKVEGAVKDLKENKVIYKKLINKKISYKKFISKVIEKLRPQAGKSLSMYEKIKNKAISEFETKLGYVKNQKDVDKIIKRTKILQEFFTPDHVVDILIDKSNLLKIKNKKKPITILEPTAGKGSIVAGLLSVFIDKGINMEIDMVEFSEDNRKDLKKMEEKSPEVLHLQKENNFMKFFTGKSYDYIFMNPPFHLRKRFLPIKRDIWDVDFVKRAYGMLKDKGGQLCAIISPHYKMSRGKKYKDWLESVGAKITPLTKEWKQKKGKTRTTGVIPLGGKDRFMFVIINKNVKNAIKSEAINVKLIEETDNLFK